MRCGVLLWWFLVLVSNYFGISNGALSATQRYSNSCDDPKCYINYTTKETSIPPVPDYLQDKSATYLCRSSEAITSKPLIVCEREVIKPKCICSFHLVYNESYHDYTACPGNSMKDSVNHLTCDDCKKYSINNSGPCLNGGEILCHLGDLASDITCSCPPRWSGRFCQCKEVVKRRECCQEATHDSNLPLCKDNQDGPCTFKDFMCFPSKTNHETNALPSCLSINTTHPKEVNHLISTGSVCEKAWIICVLCMFVDFFSIVS